MDDFFCKQNCDRCHAPLNGKRIMSMFSKDVICASCKQTERLHPDYQRAVDAEMEALDDDDFDGIGTPLEFL
jgi:hypothetical protein